MTAFDKFAALVDYTRSSISEQTFLRTTTTDLRDGSVMKGTYVKDATGIRPICYIRSIP